MVLQDEPLDVMSPELPLLHCLGLQAVEEKSMEVKEEKGVKKKEKKKKGQVEEEKKGWGGRGKMYLLVDRGGREERMEKKEVEVNNGRPRSAGGGRGGRKSPIQKVQEKKIGKKVINEVVKTEETEQVEEVEGRRPLLERLRK